MRRSQLITTYGVGAMIAIDNESFIVGGLDSWDVTTAPEIFERRLANLLGVTSFRLPPAPDPDRGLDGVRGIRFPDYYSCPECEVLQSFHRFNSPAGTARCSDCQEDLVPSRFVLGCDNGHIEDFPYWKWIHRDNQHSGGLCDGTLSIHTSADSASLRSVIISCSCGVLPVSMEGAFRGKSLMELGILCGGHRPWLRYAPPQACAARPRTMQRGSSSTWHPIMRSALSIPPWGEGIHSLIERHRLFGASEENLRWFFSRRPGLLASLDAELSDVVQVVQSLDVENHEAGESTDSGQISAGSLRQEEYRRLVQGHRATYGPEWQSFVCERPEGDSSRVQKMGIQTSMLVKRLREVRALAGFSRGAIPTEADSEERCAPLSLVPDIDWLPAMEVSGEGVFLCLDEERLEAWETLPTVLARSEAIRTSHLDLLGERAAGRHAPESPVSPRLVLLHTLAHLLINEWSLDGGYPASALRERLYADTEMAGVLIYTATSDSAGSLGGVVAQGEIARLARSLRSALERASWCSNDPLCMESEGSGSDNLNLAACHACVLLPETSCEVGNSFLDRALLIGDPLGVVPAYFSSY
ncbi:DrmB family protein [Kribbella sp. NPDC049227]|uniref:DrmB family protein n=1 Tax=Kribbella sp. NPDC049227 TaxID=3364113 RepID=UPI0037198D70